MSRIQYSLFEQSVRVPDELTCKNSDSETHTDLKIVVKACNLVARNIWASHQFVTSLSFCWLISEQKSYVCRKSIKCSVRQTFCIQMINLKIKTSSNSQSTCTNVPANIMLGTHVGFTEEFHRCVSYLSYIKQIQNYIEGRHLKAL